MFSEHSMIHEVNVMNKIICYLLIIIALLLCEEPLFMVFSTVLLLLINKSFPKLWKFSWLLLWVSIFCLFYSQFLWIIKIGVFIVYTILFKKVTKAVELRYVLENTLYHFQTKRITYRILYIIYFGKIFKNNIQSYWQVKRNYHIKISFSFFQFMLKQSYYKTKAEMNSFMEMNQIRFYNFYKKRTYIDKLTFESWDTNYLVSHVMIVLLTYFYGR